MRYLVLGAGLQAKAIVHYLLKCPDTTSVMIVDGVPGKAHDLAVSFNDARVAWLNMTVRDPAAMVPLMTGEDVVVSAVPYDLNEALAMMAIRAGTHFVDLGGNNDVEARQIALSAAAAEQGVAIAPAQGIAPGAVSVIVARLMWVVEAEHYESVEIFVGGIPRVYVPPLGYALVFSAHGLFNEYLEDTEILEGGQRTLVESLGGVETVDYPGFGSLEAAYTSGGSSTMTKTFAGRVDRLAYKTLRYPGHWAFIRNLKALGLLSMDANDGIGGVTPRQMTERAFARCLPHDVADALVLLVRLRGGRKSMTFTMTVEHAAATGLSAMQQTTGFSAAIVARFLANGTITKRGTLTTELDVPHEAFLAEWERCGFEWHTTWTTR